MSANGAGRITSSGSRCSCVRSATPGVFLRLATEWNHFQAVPDEYLDAGDAIIVFGRYKATFKATGSPLNAQFAHVWRLRNGKVIAFQQYTDTAQFRRAVGDEG